MVSAGVKELLRSCSANGAKSNFMQRHSAGEMINGFRVSPSAGAVPSSPQSRRDRALGQPAGSSLLARSAAQPGKAPCSLKLSWDLGKGKMFFRAGISILMPGRASPGAPAVPAARGQRGFCPWGDADSEPSQQRALQCCAEAEQ